MANKHSSVVEEASFSTYLCPKYEKAVEILGKRWTGLIIRALMDGPRRFNELLKIVDTVSDRLLTERLRELVKEGLVMRAVYPESPVRIEYSLTPMGQAMKQVSDAIQDWANEWITVEPEDVAILQPKKSRGKPATLVEAQA
jgi:DNA-binding HxlR family transcriptional regulator